MVATLALTALVAFGQTPITTRAVAAPVAAASAAVPKPTATPKAPLREIGRVRALTRFCSAFTTHFNAAVRPLLESDVNVGYIGYTLGSIEPHYNVLGGELKLYDDRVNMIAYVGRLQKLIPQAQREIDELRGTSKVADDQDTAKATFELARQLQKALDKQRQIAIDTLGVVQAMNDVTLGVNNMDSASAAAGSDTDVAATTALEDHLAGGYDAYTATTPSDWRDVRSYLHWQSQIDRIGDAEGSAATDADAIVDRCR